MPLELETPTKARVNEVAVLSQKNRLPDEDPGAKLCLQALVSNDILAAFDGTLKSWLFTKDAATHTPRKPKQGTLDGIAVVSDLPNLSAVGAHVKSIRWADKLVGYHLRILQGIGGTSDILIDDCIVDKFRIGLQEGGTVLIKFEVESSNVSAKTWGRLAKMKSTEIEITLTAPSVVQSELATPGAVSAGDENWPFKDSIVDVETPPRRRRKAPDATDVFVAEHGGTPQ
jgi:hypothetical protein